MTKITFEVHNPNFSTTEEKIKEYFASILNATMFAKNFDDKMSEKEEKRLDNAEDFFLLLKDSDIRVKCD